MSIELISSVAIAIMTIAVCVALSVIVYSYTVTAYNRIRSRTARKFRLWEGKIS